MAILLIPTTLIQYEIVYATSLDLHLPTMSGTDLTMARGDSWVIPVDNDMLTPEPVVKLTVEETQFSGSKLMQSR